MRLLFVTLLMASLGGCNYDRSFMSIDSDSGIPFLGLQMQVNSDRVPDDAVRVAPRPIDADASSRWMTTSLSAGNE